jgi:hypothetical protein
LAQHKSQYVSSQIAFVGRTVAGFAVTQAVNKSDQNNPAHGSRALSVSKQPCGFPQGCWL